MSTKKIILTVVIVLVLAGAAAGEYYHIQAGIVKVATGRVSREDLVSVVSGTGQIKPKTYVNLGGDRLRPDYAPLCERGRSRKEGRHAGYDRERAAGVDRRRAGGYDRLFEDGHQFVPRGGRQTAKANITQAKADLRTEEAGL